jgi:hypothetical protein
METGTGSVIYLIMRNTRTGWSTNCKSAKDYQTIVAKQMSGLIASLLTKCKICMGDKKKKKESMLDSDGILVVVGSLFRYAPETLKIIDVVELSLPW